MRDYIPTKDNNLIPWSDNITNKIGNYADVLGFTQDDVNAVQNSCKSIDKGINGYTAANAAAKKAAREKKTMLTDSKRSLRTLFQRAKKADGYTPAIGHDLGIIGADVPFNPGTYKTVLSAKVQPGKVCISFTKKGVDGVNMYARKKGETDWVNLGFVGYSPFGDKRPLSVAGTAEVRQYMAIGVMKDAEIGLMSDIIEVVFGG